MIQVENLEVFYIFDDETDFIVGFVSKNLVVQANFVEFRDNKNFIFFEATSSADI